jgi:hypothetical protein
MGAKPAWYHFGVVSGGRPRITRPARVRKGRFAEVGRLGPLQFSALFPPPRTVAGSAGPARWPPASDVLSPRPVTRP